MKYRILYSILMIITIICGLFGATILGARKEQAAYKDVDSEKGYVLFHSNYKGESITDIYTPTEAITLMKQLQKEISDLPYFYCYSDITFDGGEDASVIGGSVQKELKNYIMDGEMMDAEYHINDMNNIVIPAMIGEEMLGEYKIGDVVDGKISEIAVQLKIIGVLSEDSYIESVDTSFSTFTIPEIYFDVEAVTEDEIRFQEWMLSTTIRGIVCYNSAAEYNEFKNELSNITDETGLKWDLEDRTINRYQDICIGISSMTAYIIIGIGILGMLIIGLVHSNSLIKSQKRKQIDIVVQTRVIIKEIVNVLICYILAIISGRMVLRNNVYQYNFLQEKGCVLFCLIVYMFILGMIICNNLKVDKDNGCN